MCGIVGGVTVGTAIEPLALERACGVMSHRGPDARGCYRSPSEHTVLGHTRLSVIDLTSAANQPMVDPTGRVALAYNGELYNYRRLRTDLCQRGHRFRTSSDTEVLLNLYLEFGDDCVSQLEGMFAFAIWDDRRRRMLVARDRLGIKPLYYYHGQGTFAFGSEIKAILELTGLQDRRVNRRALHDYLTFRYTVAPDTMYQQIHKLPPAHFLVLTEAGLEVTRYWKPDYTKTQQQSDSEWIDELKVRLTESVRSHLVSDVPVGVLLSGGLDSSIVAALMQAERGDPIKTFSVAFDEGGIYDERHYARQVAHQLGTDHHEVVLTASDFAKALPAFVWHMDEPVADSASVPLYYVSELARRHVTVVLSGEGSDELFAGYDFWCHFEGFERVRRLKQLPTWIWESLVQPANSRILHSKRLETYLGHVRRPLSQYAAHVDAFMDNVFSEDDKRALYEDEYRITLDGYSDSAARVRDAYTQADSFALLDQLLYAYTMQWLPDDLLVKADKMTMAHSLELRVPFLDHTLVEFAARMPTHLKIGRAGGKYVVKAGLKKAFEGMVPHEVVHREKLGFPVPYAKWLRGELRDLVHDTLLCPRTFAETPFRPDSLKSLVKMACDEPARGSAGGTDRPAKKVWSLLVFELWRRSFGASF